MSSESVNKDHLLQYEWLVGMISSEIYRTLPCTILLDDLLQEGWIGLMDASRKYNPELGVKFTSFAYSRIRGQILDSLRRLDHLTREHRIKVKKEQIKNPEFKPYTMVSESMLYSLEDTTLPRADTAAMVNQENETLRVGIEKLRPRWQQVLKMYYEDEMTGAEIGKVLGVNESRISQIRSASLSALRRHFALSGAMRRAA